MKDILIYFTSEQGNLLIRIIIAHLLSDFVLQTNKMVSNKKYFSYEMFLHITIVFCVTLIFSLSFWVSLSIALLHYLIDIIKYFLQKRISNRNLEIFLLDQILHLVCIVIIWALSIEQLHQVGKALLFPITNYPISLYLLAYIIVVWPVGYLLKFVLLKMAIKTNEQNRALNADAEERELDAKIKNIEHGGNLIGQFERVIILTFVLLGQYEAIGFLITGKSIIRFADKNADVKSEYVLVGTMMSYAMAILVGVCVNWLCTAVK
jgi:uncharacterized membrane protein